VEQAVAAGGTGGFSFKDEDAAAFLKGLMHNVWDLQQEGERERVKMATMAAIIKDLTQKDMDHWDNAREVMRQLRTMQTRDYQSTVRVLELEHQLNQLRADEGGTGGLSADENTALVKIGPIKTIVMGLHANLGKLQLEVSMVRSGSADWPIQLQFLSQVAPLRGHKNEGQL
jgi:hypothetical protein